MPTGQYKRTAFHISIIRETAKKRIGKYRVGYIISKKGCWIWQGAQDGKGYGQVKRDGRYLKAYRFYYENKFGSIPDGLELDHKCKNKICCNPDHLEPVTHQVNCQRAGKNFKFRPKIFSLKKSGFNGEQIARMLNMPPRSVHSIILNNKTIFNYEVATA